MLKSTTSIMTSKYGQTSSYQASSFPPHSYNFLIISTLIFFSFHIISNLTTSIQKNAVSLPTQVQTMEIKKSTFGIKFAGLRMASVIIDLDSIYREIKEKNSLLQELIDEIENLNSKKKMEYLCLNFLLFSQSEYLILGHQTHYFGYKKRALSITHFMTYIALLFMSSSSYAVSTDCPNMIQLAFGLGMQTAQPAIWAELQADCCTASSISCDGSQRVLDIYWDNKGLNGTINGTAIPSSVTWLSLYNNGLTGNIPNALPSRLVFFSLDGNAITGAIPNSLPSGLIHLGLNSNAINGSIPNTLPSGLTWLDLNSNSLRGSIPSFFLSSLSHLYLNGNQMSGELPSFPSTLQTLYLGYPGYPGNQFTGTLRLNRPIELFINDNYIADVVIQNSSGFVTGRCNLDNNPLLGNPNIANLTMCTKNGLYSAALLPVTSSLMSAVVGTLTMADVTTSAEIRTTGMGGARTTAVKMAGAVMWMSSSAVSNVTLSENVRWTSISGTAQFAQKMNKFAFSLFMVVRIVISAMILSAVFMKTPFMRELKRKIKKGNTKTTTSKIEF